eukprot:TRINITY_DN28316_c0_g1_i1.p1 TRINITY_DN28316_c0_g1~~TRINITY_DN28316_c0_g1_i1.p1  ORF type:complete len:548 (+),score=19.20 TRINITY_DN28316_c0_g1_i1:111-1646(+)
MYGGPDNEVTFSVAEKWHGLAEGQEEVKLRPRGRPYDDNGQRNKSPERADINVERSWMHVVTSPLRTMLSTSAKLLIDNPITWMESLPDFAKPLGALIVYLTTSGLGEQVINVGLDKNLVGEGRNFVVKRNNVSNRARKKRITQMSDRCSHMRNRLVESVDRLDKRLKVKKAVSKRANRSMGDMGVHFASSGVTCLHFEADGASNKSVTFQQGESLFIYSGQSKLWPERRLGTLSGIAYVYFVEKEAGFATRRTLNNAMMYVHLSFFTYADMPVEMFLNPAGHRPAFYVGTLDGQTRSELVDRLDGRVTTGPSCWFCREGWSGFLTKQFKKAAADVASEYLSMHIQEDSYLRQLSLHCDKTAWDELADPAANDIMRRYIGSRVEGRDPAITGEVTSQESIKMLHYLLGSFRCSHSFLFVPDHNHTMYFGEVLAWVHLMMEVPLWENKTNLAKVSWNFASNIRTGSLRTKDLGLHGFWYARRHYLKLWDFLSSILADYATNERERHEGRRPT